MRIITGSARGRRLITPPGMDTRPTTELVKEAVFSMIQFEIEGAAVLDLFAGSGQMGLEALSRGARSCVFVDQARTSQAALRQNLEITGFQGPGRVAAQDAVTYLRTARDLFDIAFLDPPYGQGLLKKCLPLVAGLMMENGVILCEASEEDPIPQQAGGFAFFREYRYGKTKIYQYRGAEHSEP